MKFKGIYIVFVLILLIIPIINAIPPWEREQNDDGGSEIIVINQTTFPEEDGINWEMIGVIFTAVVLIGGFLLTRLKKGATSKYLKDIKEVYSTCKNDQEKCESKLLSLKDKIENDFSKGKLNEQSYDILDRKIESYLGEMRKGIIGARFDLSKEDKKFVDKVLKDGVIDKEEYEKLSKMDFKELSNEKKDKLFKLINKWRKKKN